MYNSDFFRKKILKIRKRKFKQKQFASLLGMRLRKYIRFEKGRYKPPILEIIKIIGALDCDLAEFNRSEEHTSELQSL